MQSGARKARRASMARAMRSEETSWCKGCTWTVHKLTFFLRPIWAHGFHTRAVLLEKGFKERVMEEKGVNGCAGKSTWCKWMCRLASELRCLGCARGLGQKLMPKLHPMQLECHQVTLIDMPILPLPRRALGCVRSTAHAAKRSTTYEVCVMEIEFFISH